MGKILRSPENKYADFGKKIPENKMAKIKKSFSDIGVIVGNCEQKLNKVRDSNIIGKEKEEIFVKKG